MDGGEIVLAVWEYVLIGLAFVLFCGCMWEVLTINKGDEKK